MSSALAIGVGVLPLGLGSWTPTPLPEATSPSCASRAEGRGLRTEQRTRVRACVGVCLGVSVSTHWARRAHLAHLHVLSRMLSREGRRSGAQEAAAIDEVVEPTWPHTVLTAPATIKRAATTEELTEAPVENVGGPSL